MSVPEVASKRASRRPLPGKLSSEQVLELFANRYNDVSHWTPEKIAKTYKINETIVNNLVQYYSSFNVIKADKTPGPLDRIDLV